MEYRTPVYGGLTKLVARDLAKFVLSQKYPFHAGLVLDRYLPVPWNGQPARFTSEQKGPWLSNFANKANAAYKAPDAPWRGWIQRLDHIYDDGGSFFIKPRWRWIVGLGNQTALETGITLHHTYGVPYIPGSALKGLTQALVELENPTNLSDEKKVELFGIQTARSSSEDHETPAAKTPEEQRAGEVVFVGAFPTCEDPPQLKVDVMTPHFPQYYQGDRDDPLEIEDPTPIPFLVVSGGTYKVILALRRGKNSAAGTNSGSLLEDAQKLCRQALDEMGIGGKTAKGYGYFVEATATRKPKP